MREKIFGASLIVLAGMVVFLFIAVFKNEKVAYIDTGKLLEGSKEMSALRNSLKGQREKSKANIDTLTAEFQTALKNYEKDVVNMSAKEKEMARQLIQTKQSQIGQYQQAIEQKYVSEEQKNTQDVLNNINAFITDYGAKNNYKLIFATVGGNIVYGDKGVDITEEILNGLNKNSK